MTDIRKKIEERIDELEKYKSRKDLVSLHVPFPLECSIRQDELRRIKKMLSEKK